ncbi:NAD-dependent epimerase/dehydratase family protein [Segetibacter aerophilus]|uniref:N-acetyl-alpha-D-glucosaminyl-diphospho-ditrans, o ctacis-undecaprenol 4-epimerase n=1 Tax=Segetibacter aerophilus TaxID=670293 RepID=A0A512BD77_9BACT|nr:NAD-dependent epimerase/dehydratase family protein [Segetibacter aerophilus]GEO09910.1 N-acetyl-alpha-D-glucosaminyl-diphospho-ditrans, o ctacis-undecaprenol 4-epimerase [Segetibacter aerophilus]
MNINIIGGSGFIGRNFMNLYKNFSSIVNLDKNEPTEALCEFRKVDVRDKGQLRNLMPVTEWVVLLAAEHRDDVSPVSLYYDVNVEGTSNVLDVMKEKGMNKIVFTSSVAVYGLNRSNPTENSDLNPFNHYGKSKEQAEQLLLKWYKEDETNRTLVIIRPTVVFGPGNRGNVYNLLKQIASGRFLMIGNGQNIKSMAYVGNIVSFIKHCIDSNLQGYHLFNYVDKPDLTTNQLIEISETAIGKKISSLKIPYSLGLTAGYLFDISSKIMKKKLEISSIRVRKFCATTQFSSIRVQDMNFVPPYTLKEGLNFTIKDILNEGGSIEDSNF